MTKRPREPAAPPPSAGDRADEMQFRRARLIAALADTLAAKFIADAALRAARLEPTKDTQ